jgi:hypothetical protein
MQYLNITSVPLRGITWMTLERGFLKIVALK